jgi:hypothetical protein
MTFSFPSLTIIQMVPPLACGLALVLADEGCAVLSQPATGKRAAKVTVIEKTMKCNEDAER